MFSSRKKMPAYANQQANVRIVVIIVDLFHQPISKKALLLYPSSFCLVGVDKKKAYHLRFPTPNEGRPPQKPVQREGKEGVRLYMIGVSAFPETLCNY